MLASKITSPILPRAYEVITYRVFEILSVELPEQVALNPSEDLEYSNVFYLRGVPMNANEGTIINVMFAQNQFQSQTQKDTQSDMTIIIDVYSRVTGKDGQGTSDSLSRAKCNRLLGICQGILEASEYKRLGFDDNKALIQNVHAQQIQVEDPQNTKDVDGLVMGRLNLNVTANDSQVLQEARALTQIALTKEIGDSGDEYFIVYDLQTGLPYFLPFTLKP